jgi:hypothetical protein
MVCVGRERQAEVCDGKDNNCNGSVDEFPTCPEELVWNQSDSDNGGEMTRRPRLPTDLIDDHAVVGPTSCGTDAHGRPYTKTRVELQAASTNGATCTPDGSYGGFMSNDRTNCRIGVRYKTVRMGSNVWCSGKAWGRPTGPYRH